MQGHLRRCHHLKSAKLRIGVVDIVDNGYGLGKITLGLGIMAQIVVQHTDVHTDGHLPLLVVLLGGGLNGTLIVEECRVSQILSSIDKAEIVRHTDVQFCRLCIGQSPQQAQQDGLGLRHVALKQIIVGLAIEQHRIVARLLGPFLCEGHFQQAVGLIVVLRGFETFADASFQTGKNGVERKCVLGKGAGREKG